MSELSPDARAIIDAARPAGRGTDADRERVRAALRMRLLATASVASSEVSPSPQSVAGSASGKYLAVLVLAGVVAGAIAWRSRGQPSDVVDTARVDDSVARPSTRTLTTVQMPASAVNVAAAPIAIVAPTPSVVASPAAIVAEMPASRRDHNAVPARAGALALAHAPLPAVNEAPAVVAPEPVPAVEPPPAPAVVQPASHSTLADETRRLDEARSALRTNPHNALELLDEWNAIRPNGELREERRAQRVAALCALGRIEGARLEADRLLAEAPRSPQADRVRASCAFTAR